MRGCASSGTRPARSAAPTISAPSSRSGFAARRCRPSRRCRISGCARGRGAATSGTEIRVNAGIIESVVEAGGPEGTMVEVADVFYNLPARRKFLKSDARRGGAGVADRHAAGAVLSRGRLHADQRGPEGPRGAAGASLSDRLYQIYGDRQDLIAGRARIGGLRLHGFIAALAEQGPMRGPQHVFVNRRIVKDRTIAHAISSLQRGVEQGAQPRSAPVPRDAARSRGRERASDEGRSAVSASSRWCTKWFAARSATRSARARRRN